jgi:hypothetical protein
MIILSLTLVLWLTLVCHSETTLFILYQSHSTLVVLLSGFVSRDNPYKKALVTYNMPILEYDSCIRNPSHKQFVDLFEAVLRRFTKRSYCLSFLSVSYSAGTLATINLQVRQVRHELMCCNVCRRAAICAHIYGEYPKPEEIFTFATYKNGMIYCTTNTTCNNMM